MTAGLRSPRPHGVPSTYQLVGTLGCAREHTGRRRREQARATAGEHRASSHGGARARTPHRMKSETSTVSARRHEHHGPRRRLEPQLPVARRTRAWQPRARARAASKKQKAKSAFFGPAAPERANQLIGCRKSSAWGGQTLLTFVSPARLGPMLIVHVHQLEREQEWLDLRRG